MMGLLPTFVVLVLAEAGLRYYRVPTMADPLVGGSVKLHKKSRDPMLIYELVPGAKTVREGVAIAITLPVFETTNSPKRFPTRSTGLWCWVIRWPGDGECQWLRHSPKCSRASFTSEG